MFSSTVKLFPLFALFVAFAFAGCGGGGGGPSTLRETASVSTEQGHTEPHLGGEKSIEEYGTEAAGPEREAVISAFTTYMRAIADKDYTVACAKLAPAIRREMRQFAAPQSRRKSCVAALSELLSPTASLVAGKQATGRVIRVRLGGGRGFVVFHAPGARLYQMPLVKERGRWEVSLASASVLVPSTAALEQ